MGTKNQNNTHLRHTINRMLTMRRSLETRRRHTKEAPSKEEAGQLLPLEDTNRNYDGSIVRSKTFGGRAVVLCLSLLIGIIVLLVNTNPPNVFETNDESLSTGFVVPEDHPVQRMAEDARCNMDHYALDSPSAVTSGSKQPVILHGWDRPKQWSEQVFLDKMGQYPQYLKDRTVQPMKKNSRVQPMKKKSRDLKQQQQQVCTLPGTEIANLMKTTSADKEILFFTNDKENEAFMRELDKDFIVPEYLQHIRGFEVFSAMAKGKSHSFHRHGESWLGQVEGRRMWWFLPPSSPKPDRVNACEYLKKGAQHKPPEGAISCVQEPGDIIWFPKDWFHATCALDSWTVGVGVQQGPPIRQNFVPLDPSHRMNDAEIKQTVSDCLGVPVDTPSKTTTTSAANKDWTWFDGDLNAYYNSLEKDHKRDPNKIGDYAVHRWLGEKRSTEEHYALLHAAVNRHHRHPKSALNVLDGGCGLGAGLMWMERKQPNWKLKGHTISDDQYKFITEKLPDHSFKVNLRSYDTLDDEKYDYIFSIEALIHSPDVTKTLKEWSSHLADGGIIAIIDDFLSVGTSKEDEEVVAFAKSWLANSLFTTTELGTLGRKLGLTVVENRDLDAEYRIIELNYRNKKPDVKPVGGRTHQGWMGSKWRQRLTVEGKLTYNMLVFKKGSSDGAASSSSTECATIPRQNAASNKGAEFNEITPQLMTGKGKNGGKQMACISSWYCCNQGFEWYDNLAANRTDNTQYLKLSRDLFGHYIDSFAKHLNDHYMTYPENTKGRFLDIGGTGSTASGMQQVTSKFQHFAGPLEYWILDSDPGAKGLERTLYCDIDDCPAAETCGFDVTFSHTVLEHARRPWESFDTIARLTKKGGLTMHLVPFSYQYHATPDDNYRFSHKALTSLLEDRGFTVLEVGYDICSKPKKMLRSKVDEHFDTIWLTYIIGRKN
jgi:2-polyprenyl-3-methyl-5-hydroxy-6-metoxy-1,4-benzoquinol methylase